MNKTTCHKEFNEQLGLYQASLKPFYKNPRITQMTEEQLREINAQQALAFKANVTTESFMNNTHKRSHAQSSQKQRIALVIEQEDHDLNRRDESAIPEIITRSVEDIDNLNESEKNEIVILKKKFEESESNIIHELYVQHFAHNNKKNDFAETTVKQSLAAEAVEELKANDREGETVAVGNNTTTHYSQIISGTNNNSIVLNQEPFSPSNFNENDYEKVKYVQYIPKHLKGEPEEVINSIYLNYTPGSNAANKNTLNQSTYHQTLMQQAEKRCHSQHCHARQCPKTKELDVAQLQNQAFKHLVVQKPHYESMTTKEKLARASFYPNSQLPDELKKVLQDNQEFQKSLLISDKLLMSRPRTSQNAQSRFFSSQYKQNASILTSLQAPNQQFNYTVQHQNQDIMSGEFIGQNNDIMHQRADRNYLIQQKRGEILAKLGKNHEETYDSNKLDPEFLNQQLSQTCETNMQYAAPQQKNYYFPKVSILNYYNAASQDSQVQQQVAQSCDFSMTPISQHNLKINIEKECIKFHHNNLASKQLYLSSNTQSDEAIVLNQEQPIVSSHYNSSIIDGGNNLTQNIFKPRMVNNPQAQNGSSLMISPKIDSEVAYNDQMAITKPKFFNFREVNKLQQRKWKSPFIHQKECEHNRKLHLQSNELQNFEKSFKVNHALSLNTSINNPSALWQQNKDVINLQTRKRKSISEFVVEKRKNAESVQGSLTKKGRSIVSSQTPVVDSLMTRKAKCYHRPRTQQPHLRRQTNPQFFQQRGVMVDEQIDNNSQQQDNTFVGQPQKFNQFDTESMSMSSGNINVTVKEQQSNKNIISSSGDNTAKRLIISKRSGESFTNKSRQFIQNIEDNGGGSGTLMNTSGNINFTNE